MKIPLNSDSLKGALEKAKGFTSKVAGEIQEQRVNKEAKELKKAIEEAQQQEVEDKDWMERVELKAFGHILSDEERQRNGDLLKRYDPFKKDWHFDKDKFERNDKRLALKFKRKLM